MKKLILIMLLLPMSVSAFIDYINNTFTSLTQDDLISINNNITFLNFNVSYQQQDLTNLWNNASYQESLIWNLYINASVQQQDLNNLWLNASNQEKALNGVVANPRYNLSYVMNQTELALTYQKRNSWTTHDNYPTGCNFFAVPPKYVMAIGDSLTCADAVSSLSFGREFNTIPNSPITTTGSISFKNCNSSITPIGPQYVLANLSGGWNCYLLPEIPVVPEISLADQFLILSSASPLVDYVNTNKSIADGNLNITGHLVVMGDLFIDDFTPNQYHNYVDWIYVPAGQTGDDGCNNLDGQISGYYYTCQNCSIMTVGTNYNCSGVLGTDRLCGCLIT